MPLRIIKKKNVITVLSGGDHLPEGEPVLLYSNEELRSRMGLEQTVARSTARRPVEDSAPRPADGSS